MNSMKMMATSALAIAVAGGVALAQVGTLQVVPEGRMYVYHGAASGGCPALDWHILIGANNALSGMIGWNNMQSMAKVTGTISPDRNVQMTAHEVGGKGETATITGQLRPDGWLFADIKGPSVDCKGVKVSYSVPQAGGSGG